MKTGTKVFWGAVAALAIYSIVKSNEPKKPIPPLDYTKTVYTADHAIICPLSLLSDPRADHDAMAVFDLLHLSMFNAQSKAEKLGCEVVRGGIEVTAVPMGGSDDYVVLDGVNFTADIYLTNSADGSWRSADSNTAPSSTDTSSSLGSALVATPSSKPIPKGSVSVPMDGLGAARSEAPQEPRSVSVKNFTPPATQPQVPQEPKPVPVENPNPPAQQPSIVEIDQQAIALWNQKRYSDAIPLFDQACRSGKADSCNRLGLMYDFGQGVVQDFARALAFYSKSCNAGSGAACYHLSMLPQSIPGGCNSGAVTLNLSRSCDMGIATSCSIVGYSYIHGCGVAKDTEKGRQLLSKGCSLGDYNACDGIK